MHISRITLKLHRHVFLLPLLVFLAPAAFSQQQGTTARLGADYAQSLNGTWNITPAGLPVTRLQVPGFYITKTTAGWYDRFTLETEGPDNLWKIFDGIRGCVYERSFDIDAHMVGTGRIFLRFEAVNFACRISVNGTRVLTHYGGFLPFETDITDYVEAPSAGNQLSVEIIANNNALFLNGVEGYPLWPTGFFGHFFNNGITGDVYLLARSSVYIDDIHVITSVADRRLFAEITIINCGPDTVSAVCETSVADQGPDLGARVFTAAPHDTTVVSAALSWPDVRLWSPADPHLYDLESRLLLGGETVNARSLNFGFRDFCMIGEHFYLNGKRITLLGDNIVFYSQKVYWPYLIPTRENWPVIVDSLLALNANVIRLHQEPYPSWMIDVCDRKGMLVIAESAIYGDVAVRQEQFLTNARIWQKQWIKRDRNHPSIILWSASNEMYNPSVKFFPEQIYRFGTSIFEMDTTRPVLFEGDFDLEGRADIFSHHYLYGFRNNRIPPEGIYDMNRFRVQGKPTSNGEFGWIDALISEEERVRVQSLKTRAMRIGRWADIRPYRLDWAWHPDPAFAEADYSGWRPDTTAIKFLKNSLNPVAVYDSAYYEFAAFPAPPAINENELLTRKLYIFNNEQSDSLITVSLRTVIGQNVVGSAAFSVIIEPGGMADTTVTIRAPLVNEDSRFLLRLRTLKQGRVRFSEDYPFISRENGISLPAPPARPDAPTVTCSGSTVTLRWEAVTHDTSGAPALIDHYTMYRSPDIDFHPARTDTFTTSGTGFSDSKTRQTVFYRIAGIDTDGRRSAPSAAAGYTTYPLIATAGTDFNAAALPFSGNLPGTAAALLPAIPLCTSVAVWSSEMQGFRQYLPEIPGSNFQLDTGGPVLVNIPGDTSWTCSGRAADLRYHLGAHQGSTNVHFITLPFSKYTLARASDLCADIPFCSSVARWDAAVQGYSQYIPGFSQTDFDVVPGHPYFVTLTAAAVWPDAPAAGSPPASPAPVSFSSGAPGPPHLAIVRTAQLLQHYEAVTGTARLGRASAFTLTAQLRRDVPQDSIWFIQCADFQHRWQPSDTLHLTFTDESGRIIAACTGPLSSRSDDIFTPRLIEGSALTPSDGFTLSQNYPNPFNAGTSIAYRVPETCRVTITIFDLTGRRVSAPVDTVHDPGHYSVFWNGRDTGGRELSSGIYICRVSAGDARRAIRMVYLK